jgi:hypothetical protein
MAQTSSPLDVTSLIAHAVQLIADRIPCGDAVLLPSKGKPPIYRSETPIDSLPQPVSLLGSLVGDIGGPVWQPAMRLEQILQPAINQLDQSMGMRPRCEVNLAFSAYVGGLWAAKLAEQLGVKPACTCQITRPMTQLDEFLRSLRHAEMLQNYLAVARQSLALALLAPPTTDLQPDEAPWVLLRRPSEAADIQAEWLSSTGDIVCRRPLAQVAQEPFCTKLAETTARLRQGWRLRLEHDHQVAERLLKELSPELAQAESASCAAGHTLAYWMFSAKDSHEMPLDAFLFFDPIRGQTELCVRRAFAEFVLQGPHLGMYYFGPGQVQSRIVFQPIKSVWSLLPPEIRIPSGLPLWRHLYTGELSGDPSKQVPIFNAAQMPGAEAVLFPSADAHRIVSKPLTADTQPRLGGMCIPDRERALNAVTKRVYEDSKATGQIDVLSLVMRNLSLGRQALMRGHQLNDGRPMASWEQMLYPIANRDSLMASPLSRRVFPYHVL